MAKTAFTMNFKDFDVKFEKIVKKTIPSLSAQGLFQAGALLIKDAIQEEPRAPHLSGHLWRNQLIPRPVIEHGKIELEAGFNVPYAARLHEAPTSWNWTMSGSGPKFLEAKLIAHRDKYMKFVADFIAKNAR